MDAEKFWAGFDALLNDLAPKNKALLKKRDALQAKIDAYHQARKGQAHNPVEYKTFLQEIGYLLPVGEDFQATTVNVEPEIGQIAGPQLVVPIMNARFALNAANARWGSLYDALYGTDAIFLKKAALKGTSYNKVRGDKVNRLGRATSSTPLLLCWVRHMTAKAAIEGGKLCGEPENAAAPRRLKARAIGGFVGDLKAQRHLLKTMAAF